MDELPVVLLGIRSTWKDSINAAPAQFAYGTNIRIPGDFLPPPVADKHVPENNFVRELQHRLQKLTPPSPAWNGQPRSYIPSDPQTTKDVYVRHDAVRGPLVRPYDGPYPVLSRSDKSFVILKNGKEYQVSIDRLKPAYSARPAVPQQPGLPFNIATTHTMEKLQRKKVKRRISPHK